MILKTMRKAALARDVLTHLGPRWCAFRVQYALQKRIGFFERKLPLAHREHGPLSRVLSSPHEGEPAAYLAYRRSAAPRFFFGPDDRETYAALLSSQFSSADQRLHEQVNRLRTGEILYFSSLWGRTGFPPDWHRNPITGQSTPTDAHWSRIGDFGSGDIKMIWEANRFGFIYALVRAYWRTGDQTIPELFWQLIADWCDNNAPQAGANWKCGQETSLRAMAWCFGLYGFLGAPATTPERLTRFAHALAIFGDRVEANLSYALSQKNNHGISEGMGLWTIGLLFPEFRNASRWRERGREVLEGEGRELIYDDGAFAQHSVNYHRLMLHDYIWSVRLAELNDQPFSNALRERVARAGEFLFQLQDETTGNLPLYGANDGALVLPLNNCEYHDFRPVIGATRFLTQGRRAYPAGDWDEDLLWLFGPQSLDAAHVPVPRVDLNSDHGGYYTVRGENSFAFMRCGTFRHRPSQADMLHVDLWWRGQNIAVDAGTYSANAAEAWGAAFAGTSSHNTVTVDGEDQMARLGKFLYLPWLRGVLRINLRSRSGHLAYLEGEHDGYKRLSPPAGHRRGILLLGSDSWLVLDSVRSAGTHSCRLHWLLPDLPNDWDESSGKLQLQTVAGDFFAQAMARGTSGKCSLTRAVENSAEGWRARFYGEREPALSLSVQAEAAEANFCTLFGPFEGVVTMSETALHVETPSNRITIALGRGDEPLVTAVRSEGAVEETLAMQR